MVGANIANALAKDEPVVAKLARKKVVVEHVEFPGFSLFKVQNEHDRVRLLLNRNHLFFNKLEDNQKSQNVQFVNILLETLASALEYQYTEIDFIEEFVNDWGYLLHQRISDGTS